MELTDMSELARFVRGQSVNCQLELGVDLQGNILFCIRVTPWRNSFNPNRMILVAAYDMEDAFITVVEELAAARWLPLDWKARPVESGVFEPSQPAPLSLLERTALLRSQARQATHNGNKPSAPTDLEADLPF